MLQGDLARALVDFLDFALDVFRRSGCDQQGRREHGACRLDQFLHRILLQVSSFVPVIALRYIFIPFIALFPPFLAGDFGAPCSSRTGCAAGVSTS